jgi:hypothetical protein
LKKGVENMRKMSAIIVSLLMATSFSTLAMTPVQAYISTYSWIAPVFRGYDEFYGTSVAAYRTGSTAQLMVSVINNWYGYGNITVTAVKVWMDWNVNYTSTGTPFVMKLNDQRNFMINFTVPSTTVATNMLPHSFKIYVEFSYDSSKSYWDYSPWESFAVYSADQSEYQDLRLELEAFRYTYPVFLSSEARTSWLKAQIEQRAGESDYRRGDFSGAKTQLQTAKNLYTQSIDSEATEGATLEDALTNLMNSTAQTYSGIADLTNPLTDLINSMSETSKTQVQAFMILSIGIFIGMILIGVGVIIYALAKRKMASTSATTAS